MMEKHDYSYYRFDYKNQNGNLIMVISVKVCDLYVDITPMLLAQGVVGVSGIQISKHVEDIVKTLKAKKIIKNQMVRVKSKRMFRL